MARGAGILPTARGGTSPHRLRALVAGARARHVGASPVRYVEIGQVVGQVPYRGRGSGSGRAPMCVVAGSRSSGAVRAGRGSPTRALKGAMGWTLSWLRYTVVPTVVWSAGSDRIGAGGGRRRGWRDQVPGLGVGYRATGERMYLMMHTVLT